MRHLFQVSFKLEMNVMKITNNTRPVLDRFKDWTSRFMKKLESAKWNVTPLLLGGSNLYFFTDQYCARIGLNARFALLTKEGGESKVILKNHYGPIQ